MPLIGYVCPAGTPVNEFQHPGRRNPVSHCLGKCPNPCVSPPLLAKMWDAERKNHHKGAYLSASMLAGKGCPRQTWYERQPDIELYDVPRRRYWPFRGTIIHHMIEGVAETVLPYGWLQEMRLSVPLEFPEEPAPIFDEEGRFTGAYQTDAHLVITLGGTLDAYNPYLRELDDYKTLSDLKLLSYFAGKQGGVHHPHVKDEWVWQTNIYGWMLGKTEIPAELKQQLVDAGCRPLHRKYFPTPRRIRMQLMSMMEIPFTGASYVPMGKERRERLVEDVPILPAHEVETFIRTRALQWYRWLVLGQQPPVVDEDDKWLCESANNPCPFNGEIHPNGICFPTQERQALVQLQRATPANAAP